MGYKISRKCKVVLYLFAIGALLRDFYLDYKLYQRTDNDWTMNTWLKVVSMLGGLMGLLLLISCIHLIRRLLSGCETEEDEVRCSAFAFMHGLLEQFPQMMIYFYLLRKTNDDIGFWEIIEILGYLFSVSISLGVFFISMPKTRRIWWIIASVTICLIVLPMELLLFHRKVIGLRRVKMYSFGGAYFIMSSLLLISAGMLAAFCALILICRSYFHISQPDKLLNSIELTSFSTLYYNFFLAVDLLLSHFVMDNLEVGEVVLMFIAAACCAILYFLYKTDFKLLWICIAEGFIALFIFSAVGALGIKMLSKAIVCFGAGLASGIFFVFLEKPWDAANAR